MTGRGVALLTLAVVVGVTLASAVPTGATGERHAAEPTEITGCTAITEPGEYVLAGDVRNDSATTDTAFSGLGACIAIRTDDVTLRGQGHVVSGGGQPGVVGVFLGADGSQSNAFLGAGGSQSNVTVRNLTASGWGAGVAVAGVADATLRNVSAVDNLGDGFFVENAPGTTIVGGVARGSNTGVFVRAAPNVQIAGVTAVENLAGITVRGSDEPEIVGVNASLNRRYGVGVFESANATVGDATLARNGFAGVAFSRADRGRLRNLTVVPAVLPEGQSVGVYLNDSDRNRLDGVSVADGPGWSVYARNSTATLAQNVSLGGVRVAFVATDVALDSADSSAFSGNRTTIGGVRAAATGPEGVVALTLRYSNAAVLARGIDERTLALWRGENGGIREIADGDFEPAGNAATVTFAPNQTVAPNGTVVALAGRRSHSPTVAVLRAVGGPLSVPRDSDGDGLAEDVNGDGRVSAADAAALGAYVTASEQGSLVLSERRAAAFDFDGDGRVDWSDVAMLAEASGVVTFGG